jgi:hypothetical protein
LVAIAVASWLRRELRGDVRGTADPPNSSLKSASIVLDKITAEFEFSGRPDSLTALIMLEMRLATAAAEETSYGTVTSNCSAVTHEVIDCRDG